MSLKKTKLKGIGPRLVISITLLLFLSLTVVSTIIYFLLANSLRQSDQNLLRGLRQIYSDAFLEGGEKLLENKIAPDIMVTILNDKSEVIFEKMPHYIDHDFEDEEEIEQIRNASRKLPLEEAWHTILLLSGEENNDLIQKLEYQFRLFAQRNNWQSVLPMIDNDLIEVHVSRLNESYWIAVGKSSEDREEHLTSIRYIAFMVFIPFIFIGILLSALLARGLLYPIRNLIRTIQLHASGLTMARGEVRGTGDEIDILTTEFNSLLDRNESLLTNIKNTVDNVAHDIRTPMARFRAAAEDALLNSSEQDACREALEEGLESADRILQLLNAIMDVAEAETQTMKLNKDKVSLPDLINELLVLYQYVAEAKNVKISVTIGDECYVNADRQRLLQAMSNLLDNAIKYSDAGSVVTIRLMRADESAEVRFTDQGPGIAEDEQASIWNRLYRGDKSRSTPGLGIGLSLVKAILEGHDGGVRVNSSLGKGSEFIITLPLCNEEERKV